MKRPKISNVLHLAADKYLATDDFDVLTRGKKKFSCAAVYDAADELDCSYSRLLIGLARMGCPVDSGCAFVPLGYSAYTDKHTQSARYIWLKWAALMAEEQGV